MASTQWTHLTIAFVLCLATIVDSAVARAREVNPDVVAKIQEALPDAAPATPKASRTVLVFTKTNGFRHSSIPVGIKALTLMGEATGAYRVVHSEDDSLFEPDALAQFDAVIMLNTTGSLFRPRRLPKDTDQRAKAVAREERLKQSLVQFVRGGKGLAGIHSATDTYKDWDEYNAMMGGAFAGHPWHENVPIKNLHPDHPLNAAFGGGGFEVNDEIYQFRNGTARPADRKMLLSLDGEQLDLSRGNREDGFYPISWIGIYGGGRTFYCSLGHRKEIYTNAAVMKHYLAGFQYALGDLDVDETSTEKETKAAPE